MAKCYNKIFLKKQNIFVDCGKCLNCRENQAIESSIRAQHEIEKMPYKYMVTLTYDGLNVPFAQTKNGMQMVLNKKDLTEYIEKIQRRVRTLNKVATIKDTIGEIKFRYTSAGELGSLNKRPHYHVVIGTNWILERTIKNTWKKGTVFFEKLRTSAGIFYTNKYINKQTKGMVYKNELIAFRKNSRGLGKDWIHEAIATKKVSKDRYYIETMNNGKMRLPTYYKKIFKEHIMGVKPQRKYIRKLENGHFIKDTMGNKTYLVNQNTYDANYWKWEKVQKRITEIIKDKVDIYYKFEDLVKRYLGNMDLEYYTKHYENDEILRSYLKRQNKQLEIEAIQKYYKKVNARKVG